MEQKKKKSLWEFFNLLRERKKEKHWTECNYSTFKQSLKVLFFQNRREKEVSKQCGHIYQLDREAAKSIYKTAL